MRVHHCGRPREKLIEGESQSIALGLSRMERPETKHRDIFLDLRVCVGCGSRNGPIPLVVFPAAFAHPLYPVAPSVSDLSPNVSFQL